MGNLQRLRDNIALLGAINRFPIEPREFDAHDVSSAGDGISSAQEKHLADQFAFLAAYNDDTTKIAAVCIEQRPAEAAMTIRIACNTGLPAQFVDAFSRLAMAIMETARVGRGQYPRKHDE